MGTCTFIWYVGVPAGDLHFYMRHSFQAAPLAPPDTEGGAALQRGLASLADPLGTVGTRDSLGTLTSHSSGEEGSSAYSTEDLAQLKEDLRDLMDDISERETAGAGPYPNPKP